MRRLHQAKVPGCSRRPGFRRLRHAAFAILLGMLAPLGAGAATCGGVTLPDSVSHGGTSLPLNGMGIRKATMLAVHVYVAGLYLPAKSGHAESIIKENKPWSMQMHFVHSAGQDDIRNAWSGGFENNVGHEMAALRDRVEAFNKLMPDLKKGDVLAFSYDGKGETTVSINGKTSGAIGGADFASALKAIWLGSSPPNSDLKAGLLGGDCE